MNTPALSNGKPSLPPARNHDPDLEMLKKIARFTLGPINTATYTYFQERASNLYSDPLMVVYLSFTDEFFEIFKIKGLPLKFTESMDRVLQGKSKEITRTVPIVYIISASHEQALQNHVACFKEQIALMELPPEKFQRLPFFDTSC